jgi:predicted site-specific integrase-resolvase
MNQTQTAPQQIRLNYRAKEACKYLSIGLSTLWLYVKQGKIKPNKLSQRVTIFKKSELDRFINDSQSY